MSNNNNNENNQNGRAIVRTAGLKEETPLQAVVFAAFQSDTDADSYNKYFPTLLENDITPEMIPTLTKDDWSEMGITSVGAKKKLRDAASQFLSGASANQSRAPFANMPNPSRSSSMDNYLSSLSDNPNTSSMTRPLALPPFPGAHQDTKAADLADDDTGELAQFISSCPEFSLDSYVEKATSPMNTVTEFSNGSFVHKASNPVNAPRPAAAILPSTTSNPVASSVILPSTSDVHPEWYKKRGELTLQKKLDDAGPNTLGKALSVISYYDKNVRKADDPEFVDEKPDVIAQKILDFLEKNPNGISASSKADRLLSMNAAFAFKNIAMSPAMRSVVGKQINVWNADAKKEKGSNVQNATRNAFTQRDTLHTINSVLARYTDGKIPYKVTQTICKISLGQNTGRRKTELLSIAASSIRVVLRVIDGYTIRCVYYEYVIDKNLSVGRYKQLVSFATNVDGCPGTWILLHAQNLGMCKSAYDVMMGKEALCPDPEIFESTDEAYRRWSLARVALNKGQQQKLSKGATEENVDNLVDALCSVDEQQPLRIPFWAVAHKSGGVSSKRMSESYGNALMPQLCESVGYISSNNNWLGATILRHDFRQDSRNAMRLTGMDINTHLNAHCGHTSQTALQYYENREELKMLFPSNIARQGVDAGMGKVLVENAQKIAMFETPECFQNNWPVRQEPLDDHETFLRKFGSSPLSFGNCPCPVVTCNETFMYGADARQHLIDSHEGISGNEQLTCPGCSKTTSVQNFLKKHFYSCKETPNALAPAQPFWHKKKKEELGPPPATYVFRCDHTGCTEWFWSKVTLVQHQQTKHNKKPQKKRSKRPSDISPPAASNHPGMNNPRTKQRKRTKKQSKHK